VELSVVPIATPGDANVILGQSHFIKTVEDLYEALVGSAPGIRFGLAFCEASGPLLVRWAGNDDGLIALAQEAALAIGAGHAFVVFLREAFPINVLNAVKMVPEVCRIFAATANPLQVIVGETEPGRRCAQGTPAEVRLQDVRLRPCGTRVPRWRPGPTPP
jgi:adenosine/AMP kinase